MTVEGVRHLTRNRRQRTGHATGPAISRLSRRPQLLLMIDQQGAKTNLNASNPTGSGLAIQRSWSSYRFNAEGMKSVLLTPHEEYLRLDRQKFSWRKAYRDLFEAHIDPDIDDQIRSASNGNYVLGNKRFQDVIAEALGRRVAKVKTGRPKKVEK